MAFVCLLIKIYELTNIRYMHFSHQLEDGTITEYIYIILIYTLCISNASELNAGISIYNNLSLCGCRTLIHSKSPKAGKPLARWSTPRVEKLGNT